MPSEKTPGDRRARRARKLELQGLSHIAAGKRLDKLLYKSQIKGVAGTPKRKRQLTKSEGRQRRLRQEASAAAVRDAGQKVCPFCLFSYTDPNEHPCMKQVMIPWDDRVEGPPLENARVLTPDDVVGTNSAIMRRRIEIALEERGLDDGN